MVQFKLLNFLYSDWWLFLVSGERNFVICTSCVVTFCFWPLFLLVRLYALSYPEDVDNGTHFSTSYEHQYGKLQLFIRSPEITSMILFRLTNTYLMLVQRQIQTAVYFQMNEILTL